MADSTTPALLRVLDPAWRDDTDYDAGAIKYHDGKIYKSLQASGPHRGGVQTPGAASPYWVELVEIDDGRLVHTSRNETINGRKTFSTDVVINNSTDSSELDFIIPDVTKGVTPTNTRYSRVNTYDSTNPAGDASIGVSKLGHFGVQYEDTGNIVAHIAAASPSNATLAYMGVTYPASGSPYATAPTTPAVASSNEIVTVNYLKSTGSGVVHNTGNEVIAGQKVFNNDLYARCSSSDGPNVDLQYADTVVKGVTPAPSGKMAGMVIYDSTGSNNGSFINSIGQFINLYEDDMVYSTMRAFKPEENSTSFAEIKCIYPVAGDPYALAPTTRSEPSSNEIVTVNYLNGDNSGVVHLDSNETITGSKTFKNETFFNNDIHIKCLQ